MSRLFSQFIAEIRRREVIPVVVTYAVVGWLVLQVAGLTFEPLGIPEGGVRLLIIITIAGFPAVFFLAWLIDFRPSGMIFDLPLWRTDGKPTHQEQKASRPLALMLCFIVIAFTWALVVFLNNTIKPAESELASADAQAQAAEDLQSANGSQTPDIQFPANSIAVLAFENFDGQVASNYFADGLAEEILNYLASIRELNVAARTSSFRFRGERVDVREVAKLLNVKHVLEGSVRVEGNRVRITAQLIDGKEGFHAWSKSYDRNLDDIFAIQREIASAVVNELKITLSVDSQNKLQQTQSENIDAYIFYLQGLEKLRSSEDIARIATANQLFNQALDIEPNYSRAYAGICEANLALYESSNAVADFNNAEFACEKAQSLTTEYDSDVKVALGRLYRFSGEYQKAEDILQAAIAHNPSAVDAYIELGNVYFELDQSERAEKAFLRAIDLKRNYWKGHEALANFYYNSEKYRQSADTYKTVSRLTPDSSAGYIGEGSAYFMLGDTARALTAYENALAINPSRQAYTNLGIFYFYAGEFERAVEMQREALERAQDDHRLWGRLAESYRFIPGQEAEAQFAYKRAAELAVKNIEINKEDWYTRATLGLYLIHLGDKSQGMDLLELATEQSQRNPEILYFKALAFLYEDKESEALTLLEESVTQEQSYRQFIALDPDLQRLKGSPRFQALLPKA